MVRISLIVSVLQAAQKEMAVGAEGGRGVWHVCFGEWCWFSNRRKRSEVALTRLSRDIVRI